MDVRRAGALVLAHAEGDHCIVGGRRKQSANCGLVPGYRSERTAIGVQCHPHQSSEVRRAIDLSWWLRAVFAQEGTNVRGFSWQRVGQWCEQGVKDLGWRHVSSLSATATATPTTHPQRLHCGRFWFASARRSIDRSRSPIVGDGCTVISSSTSASRARFSRYWITTSGVPTAM